MPDKPLTPETLRALMEGAGLTQHALARMIDVRDQTVSSWCVGRYGISLAMSKLVRLVVAEHMKTEQ